MTSQGRAKVGGHGLHAARGRISLASVTVVLGAILLAANAAGQPAIGRAIVSEPATTASQTGTLLGIVTSDATPATPIKHVILIDQENHSFDNVLGKICKTRITPCDGATTGKLGTKTITLAQATDIVPDAGHTTFDQNRAVDGGKMDRFNLITNCAEPNEFRCYSQYSASQIPNVAKLANTFGISDRTFSEGLFASSMQHMELLDGGTTDGFHPDYLQRGPGPGWGCNSGYKGLWQATPASPALWEPFCIPAPSGSPAAAAEPAAIKVSPVSWVPTILDRLVAADKTWKIYADTTTTDRDYDWATCPMYADCLYGLQRSHMAPSAGILTDAAHGTLPSFSLLTPSGGVTGETAQHNFDSMKVGDNWLGKVVSAIENGPDWSSTAIFLTYDDCGCFYDHVTPPAGLGIRVPMIVISPYVKPHYTDSNVASFTSVIAFTEHVFGLAPLTNEDTFAYDYMGMFDFEQKPLPPVKMVTSAIPVASKAFVATHHADPDDPT